MGSEKKRKRESVSKLKIDGFVGEPSIALGSFYNGFSAAKDAEFSLYKNKYNELLLHGESSHLEYDARVPEDDSSAYAVAVYDPETKKAKLYKAPLLLGTVSSKAHKRSSGPAVKQANTKNYEQRNALGQAFGTRRAKKAIGDLERNRIDADKLSDIQNDIVDTVKTTTDALPTRDELQKKVLDDRPTPACFPDATSVEDVYPISSIIPSHELKQIRVKGILSATEMSDKLAQLPYKNSEYIKSKLAIFTSDAQTEKLQLLYYVSLLMGVYNNKRISNKQALATELNDPADALVDGILDRFTIARASQVGRTKARSFTIDPHHEDKLLCYILALILHINGFVIEVNPLAQELSLKPTRLLDLFKALGCTIKPASAKDAASYGIPKAAAASYKIASLKVPFKMPEMTRKGRR